MTCPIIYTGNIKITIVEALRGVLYASRKTCHSQTNQN